MMDSLGKIPHILFLLKTWRLRYPQSNTTADSLVGDFCVMLLKINVLVPCFYRPNNLCDV